MYTPDPPKRRDWTLTVVIGAIGLVVVVVLCLVGGGVGLLALRGGDTPAPAPVASALPVSPSPAPSPSPSPEVSAAQCLLGDWVETSNTSTSSLFGQTVQLRSAGTRQSFSDKGVATWTANNTKKSGKAAGNTYDVITNGSFTINYEVSGDTIFYSNPKANGTMTWKVNGKVRQTAKLSAGLAPESFTCKGDGLRLYSDGYAIELARIVPSPPPGTSA